MIPFKTPVITKVTRKLKLYNSQAKHYTQHPVASNDYLNSTNKNAITQILHEVYTEVNDRFLCDYSPIIYENEITVEEIPYYEKHVFVIDLLVALGRDLDFCDNLAIYITQAEIEGLSTFHISLQRKERILRSYTLLQLVYEYLKNPEKNFEKISARYPLE
jgi:hypothetical protein